MRKLGKNRGKLVPIVPPKQGLYTPITNPKAVFLN